MTDAGLNRDQDRQIDTNLRPVAFRGAGFVASPKAWAGWAALVVVIGFWQLAGSSGWINPLFLPPPTAVVKSITQLALNGALWQHLSFSIMRIGAGWLIGTVAGVIVGFAIGLSGVARGVVTTPESDSAYRSPAAARASAHLSSCGSCTRRIAACSSSSRLL